MNSIFPFKILGIESSCDECSASVVQFNSATDLKTLSLKTYSQIELHAPFGGIVPEIASRNHLETIQYIIDEALKEADTSIPHINAISVTTHPGLVGALLVGVSTAKTLAYTYSKPLIDINHLEGHCVSPFLDQKEKIEKMHFPLLIALISGGHTNLYLFKSPPEKWSKDELHNSLVAFSRDDAAGEAFDKTAKLLGFPYPGGKYIDEESHKGGDPSRFVLPRALPQKSILEFSFSGLKTAVHQLVEKLKKEGTLTENIPHLAASIQEAIIDMLVSKIEIALNKYSCKSLALVGGVAANTRLYKKLTDKCPVPFFFPHLKYCMDNAAMIAAAGGFHFLQGHILSKEDALKVTATPSISFFKANSQ